MPGPPGVGGPPPGYGVPGWGAPPQPPARAAGPVVRHRPGVGLVVGMLGFLLTVLSYVALPWISEGGEDVSLFDIRDQFEGIDPPSDIAYFVAYARWIWIVALAAALLAILVSTAFVPSSKSGRVVIGTLALVPLLVVGAAIGALATAFDDRGIVGPRICGGVLGLSALGVHIGAYVDGFDGEGAPDPGLGVWAGVLGLVLVIVACGIGTRTESVDPWNRAAW